MIIQSKSLQTRYDTAFIHDKYYIRTHVYVFLFSVKKRVFELSWIWPWRWPRGGTPRMAFIVCKISVETSSNIIYIYKFLWANQCRSTCNTANKETRTRKGPIGCRVGLEVFSLGAFFGMSCSIKDAFQRALPSAAIYDMSKYCDAFDVLSKVRKLMITAFLKA